MKNQNGRQKNYNISALMSAYNYAKWHGKKTGRFDTKRVDRALGILKSGKLQEKVQEYQTTLKTCDCPDWQYRTIHCKHRIAYMIDMKHDEIMIDEGYWQEAA